MSNVPGVVYIGDCVWGKIDLHTKVNMEVIVLAYPFRASLHCHNLEAKVEIVSYKGWSENL